MLGKKLRGRYEIITRVGGGGMAAVYKARDSLLNRYVAIKVLNESLSNDSEFVRRFSREAQAAASLSHPNIVNVYDVGYDGYTHYIVMELVEGPTLKQYVRARAPLSTEETTTIAVQICDGLIHAHENQIVHRDIKPHNILLGSRGRVKVTDFGIARAASSATITQTGSVMGSVHYFSPEQARGESIDLKSDLYSLGIVLYEMLTGRLPFMGDAAISIALKHLQDPVADPREYNPDISEEVVAILLHALEKDPELRFNSAQTFKRTLLQAVPMDRHQELHWQNFEVPESSTDDGQRNQSEDYLTDSGLPLSSRSFPRRNSVTGDTRSTVDPVEGTILQKTTAWLGVVGPQRLPLWKRALFVVFTMIVILVLSVWGFIALWNFIRNDPTDTKDPSLQGDVSSSLRLPRFSTRDEARKFAKERGLPLPVVYSIYHPGTDAGAIWKQQPAPGQMASQRDPIRLFVGAMYPGDASMDGSPIEGSVVKNYVGGYESRATKDGATVKYCDATGIYPNPTRAHVVAQSPPEGSPSVGSETLQVIVHIPGTKSCNDVSFD
ncbi:Stk1 family PASTA domain-containing Ser/Thr kinase [Pasteuria penetrans]|uniref:Stk1 family PASTA domain-containing Ser/Thr kinase n=1 Tax=Pasteuria penetrans TaxID=86005 RepID=UPI000FAF6F29|nr:Stk1 family PASTA domain-containing Ser/Thr kinase [Pasteuria penetrans]